MKAVGLGLCTISYDNEGILRDFAARRGITFPMLADPTSAIIRRFGLFNDDAKPDSRDYGMAHPGILIVDVDAIVRERFFEERYYHRLTMPSVLSRLGATMVAPHEGSRRDHLEVTTSATQASLHPGNRVTLFIDVIPAPGVHVYGPSVAGYQGLAVQIDPQPILTVYPPTLPAEEALHLTWTDETLSGYARPARIALDVALGTRFEMASILEAGQGLAITGTLLAQACDDRVCWAPEQVPLRWHFDLVAPDLERSPDEMQHKAKGPTSDSPATR